MGVGASAGGLEALEEFFDAVPVQSGLAFVVVSHQRPGHVSLLPELLGKHARIPVVEAASGMRLQADNVYLGPPGSRLSLRQGELHVAGPVAAEPHAPLPIDSFFRSMAADLGPDAIGIVLSGSGSDGTLGLNAIKGHAGMTIAQDPGSARYASMPQSAIATGAVDYVYRPRDMPEALLKYVHRVRQALPMSQASPQVWQRILHLLQERSGVDFSVYKVGTAQRRVERRMHVNQVATLGEYLQYLEANSSEVDALFSELLIGVTSFFRDPGAFEVLARELPALLDGRPEGSSVRLWVAGCSTGEEAYAMGIVLEEYLAQRRGRLHVQIFGTDLDSRAIEAARAGFYPAGIVNDVTPRRLERFFVKEDAGYRVRKELRDLVVFSVHNLLTDPPFFRLDVLSCRNLMIYVESPSQQRLLRLFHRALNPGGLLLLGSAESVEEARDLYTAVDRKWKLFRRSEMPTPPLEEIHVGAMRTAALKVLPSSPPAQERAPSVVNLLQTLLLDEYAPVSVVVDNRGEVVFIHGRTGTYLEPAPGRPTHVLVDLTRPGLRAALAAVLKEAASTRREAVRRGVRFRSNSHTARVDIVVRPVTQPEAVRGLLLVTFVPPASGGPRHRPLPPTPAPARGQSRGRGRARESELVEELDYTKERLRHSLEEQQATNEELMSSNEEMASTNEELQSTNEELETTREEMQSLNEELQTVNAELRAKLDDLGDAHSDLQNLLNSTDIATIFLDKDLSIKRFTPQARQVFHLIPSDVGRPLADLLPTLAYDRLMDDARDVLHSLTPCEREVHSADGTWYVMRILPYRTMKDTIGGLVLTFVNVTRAKQGETVLSQARTYFESIVDTVRGPLIVLDSDRRVVSANRAFYRTFDVLPADVQGRLLWDVAGGAWSTDSLREQVERVLPESSAFESVEIDAVFPRVGRKHMVINGRRMEQQIGLPGLILLAMEERPGAP
ncbi:MAG TPA: chemotaxis protein CheB [Candidatus Acidoferrum sp.]|nr:chemotaxis protein CheB [Candidatus Acidoferrum sp.]